ncbi:MAG: hypothetical protein N3A56_00765 [Thermodesulfobacteriaceae bacterium]|nr:hypothetical protein [Thermodesulfobacteriaceae bacterium]
MKEKFLIRPYFENLFTQKRNISVKSFEVLPSEVKLFLDYYLKKMLALYNQKVFPVSVKLSDKNLEEIILMKDENLPSLKEKDFLLLILPTEKARYIFQTVVKEELEEVYKLKILDPRVEERYKPPKPISVFLSYLTEKNILTFLNQDYLFIRDSNLSSLEEVEKLGEIYFFDLILNPKDQVEDDFIKIINKIHLKGELVDISRRGLCITTSESFFPSKENTFFYVRFQLDLPQKQIFKFGLLCHLRNVRTQNSYVYLHLMYFLKFNFEIWEKLKERIKCLAE